MALSDDYGLRGELVTMDDVADIFDLFSNEEVNSYTPTTSVTLPMTIASVSLLHSKYWQIGDLIMLVLRFTATIGGTNRYEIYSSLPFAPSAGYSPLNCNYRQPSNGSFVSGVCYPDGASLTIKTNDNSEFTANTIDVTINGWLRID